MSLAERGSISPEFSEGKPTYGVVLTAGSQKKKAADFAHPWVDEDGEYIYPWKYRIEPDLEGKLRCIAALHDLVNGRISRIYISGGARNYERPLADIYFDYMRRFIKRYSLDESQIVKVEGGVNTETDLEKTKKVLKREKFQGDLVLYSSGYHFERRSIDRFRRNFKAGDVQTQAAETKIQERHKFYQMPLAADLEQRPLAWRILTPEHLERMRARNRKMDKLPQVALNLGAYFLRR